MDDFLTAMQRLNGGYTTDDILEAIAPRLSLQQCEFVLDLIDGLDRSYDSWAKERNLKALAVYLPDTLVGRAVEIANSIPEPSLRVNVLLALGHLLTASQYGELLDTISAAVGEIYMPDVLKRVASHLPEDFFRDSSVYANR